MANQPAPQCSAFTSLYNGIVNRIVLPVELADAFDPANPPASIAWHKTDALWDTGATNSVIKKATAVAMGLVPSGSMIITHGGGSERRDTYVLNVHLPNRVLIVGVLVADCHDTVGPFGAIIGMDIISRGDLTISNWNSQTCMSFRIPSMERVDYVKDLNRRRFAGVGRNDPCPCGAKDSTGKPKKFKHCHGSAGSS
jgi:hypothetical protein